MFRVLLEGVYNHGEVIWLETSWLLRRLFGSFIHSESLGHKIFDGWLEVMPRQGMLRYCNWQGSVTYRYYMVNDVLMNGKPVILKIKGWKCFPETITDEAYEIITKAHDKLFYSELEVHLSEETVPVESSRTSKE